MSYQKLRDLFRQLNSKNIVYNKAYYKLTKCVPGAVLLSHLTYLFSEVFDGKEFYQSDNQLKASLGFSDRTLRTAKQNCKGFVTSAMRGSPAKNHWMVNEDAIIQALVSDLCVKASYVENDKAGPVENDKASYVENDTTYKKKELKKKELKRNSSSAAVTEVEQLITSSPVARHTIAELIAKHGEPKVVKQLKNLQTRFNVTNPAAWLVKAVDEDYEIKDKTQTVVHNLSPASYDIWSESHQKKYDAEREKLANKNDWRDQALNSKLAELTRSIKTN